MRKYKCNPPKPGYYIAWYDGDTVNKPWMLPTAHANLRYWDGTTWYQNEHEHGTMFMDYAYTTKDRWSYIPKEKSKC